MEHTRRQDEIGRLARSFDRMRVDIGAQQKEIMRLAYWGPADRPAQPRALS